MKMKKISVLITVLGIVLITTVESCKKYPEGPAISLRSRSERLANTWRVENYKINGSDRTSLVSNYTETFLKNGDYSYSWGILSGSGHWTFQNNDKEVKLLGTDSHASRTLFILKLEENALWYYYMDGNDKNELHLIPN